MNYGAKQKIFSYIWLLKHITLYQRKLKNVKNYSFNKCALFCFTRTHFYCKYCEAFLSNWRNCVSTDLATWLSDTFLCRLPFGCVFIFGHCNIVRVSWDTEKQKLSYPKNCHRIILSEWHDCEFPFSLMQLGFEAYVYHFIFRKCTASQKNLLFLSSLTVNTPWLTVTLDSVG